MNIISTDLNDRLLRLKESFNQAIATPVKPEPADRTLYLVFRLNQEFFAWPAVNLKEIVLDLQIGALPGCPADLHGMVNYKNRVLSVINLHHHLNLDSAKPGKSTILLLTRGLAVDCAVLVNGLVSVAPVAKERITSGPIPVEPENVSMVSGKFHHQGRMVSVLNPAAFSG